MQPLVLMDNPAAARLLDDLVCEVTAQETFDLHKFPFQGMYLSRLKASREGSPGPYWAEKRDGITVFVPSKDCTLNLILEAGQRKWQCKGKDFLQVNAGVARALVHAASPLYCALLHFGDPAIALPSAIDAPREVLSHKLCFVDIADPLLIFLCIVYTHAPEQLRDKKFVIVHCMHAYTCDHG